MYMLNQDDAQAIKLIPFLLFFLFLSLHTIALFCLSLPPSLSPSLFLFLSFLSFLLKQVKRTRKTLLLYSFSLSFSLFTVSFTHVVTRFIRLHYFVSPSLFLSLLCNTKLSIASLPKKSRKI